MDAATPPEDAGLGEPDMGGMGDTTGTASPTPGLGAQPAPMPAI